ncbi:MAG: UDP-N-acetylmuramoyl-tripeptide--D-alanyl-D-alanine ligase, partial [Krumholzibacteria bacterium]|nr:UDP-N-acetylmuramoyl-tripeptide--D-alanyl-D-alanine ligase [Candidatus Krumholzibacteria bacterium]
MAERLYTARQAGADLARAGLLDGMLVERAGALVPGDPGAAPGGFLGAGLDSRQLGPGALFVALQGERVDGRGFAPAVLMAGHWVLTAAHRGPGPDPLAGAAAAPRTGALLCTDPVAALQELARCWRRSLTVPTVAVTGTNGKTTTKDLLAALLQAAGPIHATMGNLNNHLGVPVTLLGLRPEHRYAVVEMGASAVGEIARLAPLADPAVGIITNASPAHLAGFRSLEDIILGKGELVAALPPDGTAVLNAASPGFAQWRLRSAAPVVSFGPGGDHPWSWRPAPDGSGLLEIDQSEWPVPLPGEHNGANLAAAILAGRALGVGDATLRRGLAGFTGSPHRGVRLDLAGRRVLDDAYNANPRSMVVAARALLALPGPGRAVAVLGWMAELGPDSDAIHRQTGRELAAVG